MTDGPDYTHGAFCWYEVASRDVAAVKPFYAGLFGYQMEDQPMPGGGGTYTMMRLDGKDVGGLYEMAGEMFEGVPPHWMPYVWVDSVADTVAKTRALGGEVMAEPMDIPNIGQMAVIRDPSGAVISVYHPGGHGGSAKLGFTPGSVGWNELMTPDPAAAEAFYTQLFGWGTSKTDTFGFTYTTFLHGSEGAAGMMPMQGPQFEGVPPHWMPYVTVASTDETVARARELGGEVLVGPDDVPGIGRFAVMRDPSGAAFSVMQWAPEMLA
jgi:predicted enzyme related to lactoylglutathione lyase